MTTQETYLCWNVKTAEGIEQLEIPYKDVLEKVSKGVPLFISFEGYKVLDKMNPFTIVKEKLKSE